MVLDLFTTVCDMGLSEVASEERTVLPLRAPGFRRDRDTGEEDSPLERPAYPSRDELLYAEQLRLRLKERYPERATTAAAPWFSSRFAGSNGHASGRDAR